MVRWVCSVVLLWAGATVAGCGGGGPEGEVPLPPERGDGPRLFAPGVISTGDASDDLFPTFSPYGERLLFVRRLPGGVFTIYESRWQGGAWTEPVMASFSGRYTDQEPAFSPDGERVFFTSNRPVGEGEPIPGRDVWVVERRGAGWGPARHVGRPVSLPAPVPGSGNRFLGLARGPRETRDGRLCFWAERPDEGHGATDIYCSPRTDSGYAAPVNLGAPPNSQHFETGFFVHGERIFFSRDCGDCPDGQGAADLYVSHRLGDGWSVPRNLGPEINSSAYDFAPVLHPDGRHLLFSSNRGTDQEETGRQNIYIVELASLRID